MNIQERFRRFKETDAGIWVQSTAIGLFTLGSVAAIYNAVNYPTLAREVAELNERLASSPTETATEEQVSAMPDKPTTIPSATPAPEAEMPLVPTATDGPSVSVRVVGLQVNKTSPLSIPTETPEPTDTPIPTFTATSTVTATPSLTTTFTPVPVETPTVTPTSTETPTPTETSTSTSTEILKPTREWIIPVTVDELAKLAIEGTAVGWKCKIYNPFNNKTEKIVFECDASLVDQE